MSNPGLDRTYEELKLQNMRGGQGMATSLDRTYEELKLQGADTDSVYVELVWIVPMRN